MDNAKRPQKHPVYQIRVKGSISEKWSDWLDGLSIQPLENSETLLTGSIVDQAALYGILWKLRDLNLTLTSVGIIEEKPVGRETPG